MAVKILPYYATGVLLDLGDGVPQLVTMHAARLSPDQYASFEASMKRLNEPTALRLLGGRKQDGPEQEKNEAGAFLISDRQITRIRVAELSPEAKATYDAAVQEEETWARKFVRGAVDQYVTFPEGEITGPSDEAITKGLQLVDLYPGCLDMHRALVMAVYAENTVGPQQKKIWRSLSGSNRSSGEVSPAAVGTTPAPTAAVAVSGVSAENVAATASPVAPSGSAGETGA